MRPSPGPAMAKMLRCLSRRLLACWVGRRATAAPATKIEHTRQTTKATVSVPMVVSFLLDIACQPPLDIGLNYKVVNQWCTEVGKQDGQHHAFRERRVDRSEEHTSELQSRPHLVC